MNTTSFTQSHIFKIIITAIAALVLLLVGFSVGQFVGYHKASFAYQDGNNFYHAFGPGNPNADTHGTVGKVVSITLPTITIEDRDNIEKTILVSSTTIFRHFQDTITANNIAVGDYVVAIGTPNTQSQIAATLVRILPPPPSR